jgi:hypothetical protein
MSASGRRVWLSWSAQLTQTVPVRHVRQKWRDERARFHRVAPKKLARMRLGVFRRRRRAIGRPLADLERRRIAQMTQFDRIS